MKYDLDNMTIERGVTKPAHSQRRASKWYQTFDTMEIGDSFAIPFDTESKAVRVAQSIQTNKKRYREKHNEDFDGSVRILYIKKEVRFWRDK